MTNYVEKTVNGITKEVADFTEYLLDKGTRKGAGYKFKKLTAKDFKDVESFSDYVTAVDTFRTVFADNYKKVATVTNASVEIPELPAMLSRVLDHLGIDKAIMQDLTIVPLKYVGNRIDRDSEWGKEISRLEKENASIEKGEKLTPAMNKDGTPKLDSNGKQTWRKMTAKEKDAFIEANVKKIKDIKDNKPCFRTTCFDVYSLSTFREQIEQVIAEYLAGIDPLNQAFMECFTKRYAKAMKYGMSIKAYREFAITRNYADFKVEFDKLEKAYKEKNAEELLAEVKKEVKAKAKKASAKAKAKTMLVNIATKNGKKATFTAEELPRKENEQGNGHYIAIMNDTDGLIDQVDFRYMEKYNFKQAVEEYFSGKYGENLEEIVTAVA